MGGFLQPLQNASQDYATRQNQLRITGLEQAGEAQRQQERLAQQHLENSQAAWLARQANLDKAIQDQMGRETNPHVIARLADLHTRLMSEKRPEGVADADRDFGDYDQEFMKIQHDKANAQAYSQAQAAQALGPYVRQPATGQPTPPGQTPGQTPMIRPIDQFGIPMMSGSGATPPTSPVSPAAQTGGGNSPVGTFRRGPITGIDQSQSIPPVTQPAQTQPQPIPDVTSVPSSPPPPPTANITTDPVQDQLDAYKQEYYMGNLPPDRQKFLETQIQNLGKLQLFRKDELSRPPDQRMNPIARQEIEGRLLSGEPVNFPGAVFTIRPLSPRTMGKDILRGDPNALDINGMPLDPAMPYSIRVQAMDPTTKIYTPLQQEVEDRPNADGTLHRYNKITNEDYGSLPGSTVPALASTKHYTYEITRADGSKQTISTTEKLPSGLPGVREVGVGASGPPPVKAPSTPSFSGSGVTTKTAPYNPNVGFQLNTKVRPFNPSSRLDGIVLDIARDSQNWKEVTNANDKYNVTARMHELGLEPNNLTTSMREQATRAGQVLDHLNQIDSIIDEVDKAGKLNNLAVNWNKFLTQGSASLHIPGISMEPKKFTLSTDDTVNQAFSRLQANLGFLATAVGMTHGGMRAGSSEPIIDHWEKILSANDAKTLRARLAEARNWMKGYASMRPSQEQIEQKVGAGPAGAGGGAADPANVRKFLTGK